MRCPWDSQSRWRSGNSTIGKVEDERFLWLYAVSHCTHLVFCSHWELTTEGDVRDENLLLFLQSSNKPCCVNEKRDQVFDGTHTEFRFWCLVTCKQFDALQTSLTTWWASSGRDLLSDGNRKWSEASRETIFSWKTVGLVAHLHFLDYGSPKLVLCTLVKTQRPWHNSNCAMTVWDTFFVAV